MELGLGQSSYSALALSPRLSHWRFGWASTVFPAVSYAFLSLPERVRTAQRCLHWPLRGAEKEGANAEVLAVWWHKIIFPLERVNILIRVSFLVCEHLSC